MKDRIISTISGAVLSVTGLMTSVISQYWEVLALGIIGGIAGMIGKWMVDILRYHCEKRFGIKNRKNDKKP